MDYQITAFQTVSKKLEGIITLNCLSAQVYIS